MSLLLYAALVLAAPAALGLALIATAPVHDPIERRD